MTTVRARTGAHALLAEARRTDFAAKPVMPPAREARAAVGIATEAFIAMT